MQVKQEVSQLRNKTFSRAIVSEYAHSEGFPGPHQRLVIGRDGRCSLIVRFADGLIRRIPVTVCVGGVIA